MSNSTMKFIATDPDGVLFIAQFLLMFVPGWGLVYSTLAGFLRAEAYKEANPDDLIGYYLILIETVAFLGAAKGADLAVKLLVKASSTSKRVIISWFMKHGSKPTSEASVDALKLLSAEQQAIINAMIRNPESIKIASETAVKTIQNQFVRFFANSLKNLTKLARSLNDLVLITWLKSQLRNATSPQAVKLINSIVSFALTWEGFSAIYEFTSAEAIEFLKAWAEDSGYNERALQKEYVKFADEAINNLIEKDPQAVARIMETNKTKDSFHVSPEMIEKAEKSTKEWKRQNPEKAKNMIDLSATNDSTSVLDLLGGVNESKILDKIIRATLI